MEYLPLQHLRRDGPRGDVARQEALIRSVSPVVVVARNNMQRPRKRVRVVYRAFTGGQVADGLTPKHGTVTPSLETLGPLPKRGAVQFMNLLISHNTQVHADQPASVAWGSHNTISFVKR